MRQPGLHHRLLGALMDAYTQAQMGYALPFAAELFDTYGVVGFSQWASKTADARDRAVERWGSTTSDMLVAITAAWNGCRWCSRGHLRAANLAFLRDTDALYALDEAHMEGWQHLRDGELVEQLSRRLIDADLQADAEVLRRLFELRAGAQAANDDDQILLTLVAAWDLLSECSVLVDVGDQVPALDTDLARDDDLNARYEALRRR